MNSKKIKIGIVLITVIFAIVLIYLSLKTKSPEINFSNINSFEEAKTKHTVLWNSFVVENNANDSKRKRFKSSLDSAYLVAVTSFLDSNRLVIASQETSLESKIIALNKLIEEHNIHLLLLKNPQMTYLDSIERVVQNDINKYNFEFQWQNRTTGLMNAVQRLIEEEGSHYMGSTEVYTNEIRLIDSSLVPVSDYNTERMMRYTVEIIRVYKGLFGTKKYHGRCEWVVKSSINQPQPQANRTQYDCYRDESVKS
jgi:hypothetical protein